MPGWSRGLELNLKRLLSDIEPLLRKFVDDTTAARAALGDGYDYEPMSDASGYAMLHSNLFRLSETAVSVEKFVGDLEREAWTGKAKAE